MKKNYLYISYLATAIFGFATSPAFSQYAQPVGMRQVGSQQYIGQNQQIINPSAQPPMINSIYATPMQRVNEIPLYGKNKSMYFYNQPKNQDGLFADGGLYVLGSFSTGKTTKGVNAENFESSFFNGIGSNAHTDMGDPTGVTLGFGRTMSSDLNLEMFYTKHTGMNYGNYVQTSESYEPTEDEAPDCYDEDGMYICPPDTTISDGYEVVSGGKITSDFFGIGFQYKLDHMFGTLLGGMLKPYVGFQVGLSMNTLDDYKIEDPYGYSDGDVMFEEGENPDDDEIPNAACENATKDSPCYQYDYTDGDVTYIGKTNRNIGYALEAGFTIALENNMEIDLFYKHSILGKAKTNGVVLSSYYVSETKYFADPAGSGSACTDGYSVAPWPDKDGAFCYYEDEAVLTESETKRNVESGDVVINEFGIKIKYMF